MALQLARQTIIGSTVSYHQVQIVSSSQGRVGFGVASYVDEASRAAGAAPEPVASPLYTAPLPAGGDAVVAAYAHLKGLPEWAGAEDC